MIIRLFPLRFAVSALALALVSPLSAQYLPTILASNPLAYYRLEETSGSNGTTIADSSGNGRNGTIVGTLTTQNNGVIAGSGDYAISGFTTSNYVRIATANLPSAILGSNTKFVELWFNPTSVANQGLFYIGADGGGGGGQSFRFLTDGSGNLKLDVSSGVASSSIAITAGSFNYVFAYWNGTNYVVGTTNGTTVTKQTLGIGTASNIQSSAYMNIGYVQPNSAAANGVIDEVALYGSVLSDATILAHYAALSSVPEPSTYALLAGSATLLLACFRRRRRRV